MRGRGLALALALAGTAAGRPQGDLAALTAVARSFDLLDNGDFREVYGGSDPERRRLVPWWRAGPDGGRPERFVKGGETWVVTRGAQSLTQPVAGYGPWLGELVVRGRVTGPGVLTITDGGEGQARFPVGAAGDEPRAFTVTGAELAERLGRAPRPRLLLSLSGGGGVGSAAWTALAAEVALPCPDEATLRAAVLARLELVLGTWLERGRPEGSGFVQQTFDVLSGERLGDVPGGLFPVFEHLLEGLRYADVPAWRAGLDAFLADYLARGLDGGTGLPVRWGPDGPLVDGFVEIGGDLRFLLDVADHGPEAWRERAAAAARRMGEAVLAHGVLPDGALAAKYRARDGALSLAYSPLRRLDVAAQLARLAELSGQEAYLRAARNALAELEYTHHWPGTWSGVDPGFDDDFGHYGARAVTMLAARPDEPAFRAMVDSGWRRYAEPWGDALRFGGTIAADQVRCWELLGGYAALEPAVLPALAERLDAAVRAHFKSQQYKSGAWGDVTFQGFDPKTGIEVGDLPGAPANLLLGLGLVYEERFGLRTDRVRAMAATLLVTTDEHYRRAHGYLLGPRELPGPNMAGGGIRLCPGWLALLARLAP